MAETFLSIVLDTGAFLNHRRASFAHLDDLIQNGSVQISGITLHVPYAVKSELRVSAVSHRDIHVQKQALAARRWLADNQDGLHRQTWLANATAEELFPGRAKDQVLYYACQLLLDGTAKYQECWLVTEDRLLQASAKSNGLQTFSVDSFRKQIKQLFPVNYLNTKWMLAAMENRMEHEMTTERRKRAKFILVAEVGVLLKAKTLENFLRLLEKDRRGDFVSGIQIDVPKVVVDQLREVQVDIACRYRHPDVLVERALKLMERYSAGKKDSHVVFYGERLTDHVEGKSTVTENGPTRFEVKYEEGVLRYCRRLVESLGETHVVALLTEDGSKRKLMRTEKFQVVTLWPA